MSNKRRQRAEERKGRRTDRLNDRACGRGTPHTQRGGDLSQHNSLCYSPPLSSILDGLLGLLLFLSLEPVHVGFEQVAVGKLKPDQGFPYNTFIRDQV
jgi:hypothetical protein